MLDIIRGAVRPIVLLVAVLATVAFITTGIAIPEAWWSFLGLATAYYFMRRQQT